MISSQISSLQSQTIKSCQTVFQQTHYQRSFPLVLEPTQPKNFLILQEYIKKHRQEILNAASEHGAVLFRNFDIASAEEWTSLIYQLGLKKLQNSLVGQLGELIVGSLANQDDAIVTSSSTPGISVPFHHSLSHTPFPPSHLSFFCLQDQFHQGSTPIIRSDLVLEFIRMNFPQLYDKFDNLGVRYLRVYPLKHDVFSPIGKSWKQVFNVQTKFEAQQQMKDLDMEWEWLENGDLKTVTSKLPAIITSSNHNKFFANLILLAFFGWNDSRNMASKSVLFSDYSFLPEDQMLQIKQFTDHNKCVFKWQKGDYLLIDNSVVMHTQEPAIGNRKILMCLTKDTKLVEDRIFFVLPRADKMPVIGLGTWKIPTKITQQSVYQAIINGYRLIDMACDYGNEQECGIGIRQCIKKNIVTRKDLWLTSKLWNTYHKREHVKLACQKTLDDLEVEYLDLYLVHFPVALKFVEFADKYPPEWINDSNAEFPQMVEEKVPMQETWQAMEELVEEGKVRNIGLSNTNIQLIRDILSYCKIKPAVLQVELHPFNTQKKLLKFCRDKGITVQAYSSFGSISYVPIKLADPKESLLENKQILKVAGQHGKTPAQVLLRWAIQRGTGVIPKTQSEEKMKENINIFDFLLSDQEMMVIDGLNVNKRYNDPGVYCEKDYNTFYPLFE